MTHSAENDAPLIRFGFHRSLIDWEDDGNVTDYGWHVTLYVRGQHRVRWCSTRNTTRMWPGLSRGADENCNRSITVMLWPLGHLNVWWEPNWRTDEDGPCDECRDFDARFFPPAEKGQADA